MSPIHKFEVILVSANENDRLFAAEVAAKLGLRLSVHTESEAAAAQIEGLARKDLCLLFVDACTNEKLMEFNRHLAPWIGAGKAGVKQYLVHPNWVNLIMGTQLEASTMEVLPRNRYFGSLLFRQPDAVLAGARTYVDILRRSSPSLFSAGASAQPDQVESFEIEDRATKEFALGVLRGLLEQRAELQERMIQTILSGVDELLINALMDAPLEREKQRVPALENRAVVGIVARLGADSISISVGDGHGSFDRFGALRKILPGKCGADTQLQANTQGARAGIGLAFALRMGACISVVLKPRVSTQVTLTYRPTERFTEFRRQFQAISILS